MGLPQQLTWDMAQNRWASIIDPILSNPLSKAIILPSVTLTTGVNIINHKLGRKLQGWYITRIRASATVFDTQDANQSPQLTLQLTASANVVVDLVVF